MKTLASLNRVINNVSGVLLAIMTIFVLLQVFFRYVLKSPLSYSEELARFAMIWTVMLGATVAFRHKSHIFVNFFVEKLPRNIRSPIRIGQNVLVFIFCIILVFEGYDLSMEAMNQLATASKIPVGWIVISIPISGLVICLYIIEEIIKSLTGLKNKTANHTKGQT